MTPASSSPSISKGEKRNPPIFTSKGARNTSGTNDAHRKTSANSKPSVSQRFRTFTKVATTSLKSSQKPRLCMYTKS